MHFVGLDASAFVEGGGSHRPMFVARQVSCFGPLCSQVSLEEGPLLSWAAFRADCHQPLFGQGCPKVELPRMARTAACGGDRMYSLTCSTCGLSFLPISFSWEVSGVRI